MTDTKPDAHLADFVKVSETATPMEVLAADPQVQSLVKAGIQKVVEGKISLSDLFQTVIDRPEGAVPDLRPPVPPKLTDEQKAALERLPEVYGKVVLTSIRKLTAKEAAALVEERGVIDAIIGVLEKRKSESIREVLSNHMDMILTDEEKEQARHDAKGHWAVKHEDPVDGTGKKIQRSVSGGKPRLTVAHVNTLHEAGVIDRKTYLAITRKPDEPRVLDESGLHRAIQKDPALFFALGSVAEPTAPTTTIKVVPDK